MPIQEVIASVFLAGFAEGVQEPTAIHTQTVSIWKTAFGPVNDFTMKGQMGNAGQMIMAITIYPLAILRLIGALVFALFLTVALAQQSTERSPDEQLNGLTVILDHISAALSRQGLSNDELKSLGAEAVDAGAQARAIALAHDPVVADLRARLDQLKPETAAPAEPDSPADPLSRQVAQIQAELRAKGAIVKRARAIETRARQQASQITGILRDHFNQRIFGRTTSFLNPALWIDVAHELPASASRTRRVWKGSLLTTPRMKVDIR